MQDIEFETPPIRALVNTNFTKKHVDISQEFIDRIVELLKMKSNEPTTYGISSESYYDIESLKIKVTDKMTMDIQLRINK